MIKLIAADMDGTLLDNQKRISPRLLPLLEQLLERGVYFAVASGRQYYNLLEYFPGFEDRMYFLAENSSMIFYQGKLLHMSEIPAHLLQGAVDIIRQTPDTYPIFSTPEGAFVEGDDEQLSLHAAMYYARRQWVPDIMQHTSRVCKLATFHVSDAEHGCYAAMCACRPELHVSLSGQNWVDLMNPGTDKGSGMAFLQRTLDIAPDECAAFGDYLNDAELMGSVKYNYAMANAHPDLKKLCQYEAPSNEEDGVCRVIEQWLKQDMRP